VTGERREIRENLSPRITLGGPPYERGGAVASASTCTARRNELYSLKAMWRVVESKAVTKALDRAQLEVRRRWDIWIDIIELEGPDGLRAVKGFHDEALQGNRKGERSSRLGISYRVIYRVHRDVLEVHALEVTKHDYRKR